MYLIKNRQSVSPDIGRYRDGKMVWGEIEFHHNVITVLDVTQLQGN